MPPPTRPTPEDLRAFRARAGFSQAALAAALGAGVRTVEDWEAGRRSPPAMLTLALRWLELNR